MMCPTSQSGRLVTNTVLEACATSLLCILLSMLHYMSLSSHLRGSRESSQRLQWGLTGSRQHHDSVLPRLPLLVDLHGLSSEHPADPHGREDVSNEHGPELRAI